MKRWHVLVFLAFVFLTFFDTTIQWYTQIQTYPISALVGQSEFALYGQSYETRLVLALYIPYSLLILSNLFLLVRGMPAIPRAWFALTLPLNVSILFISLFLAVPIHMADSALGYVSAENLDRLLQINGLRLLVATLSSLIVLAMLVRLLNMAFTPLAKSPARLDPDPR